LRFVVAPQKKYINLNPISRFISLLNIKVGKLQNNDGCSGSWRGSWGLDGVGSG
jgi:hypothetical protein